MLKQKSEKIDVIPLLEIIKKEYGIRNIFFVIISMLFIGVFRTFMKQYLEPPLINYKVYYVSIVGVLFFLGILLIGLIPFIKIIVKDIFTFTWPSFTNILIQLIKVVIFTVILVFIIYIFKTFYLKYLNPFLD